MGAVTAIELAAGLAVLAGAALQSATGFGFSLVAAPVLFSATEPAQAVGLLTLLGAEVNLLTLAGEGRRPTPLMPESALLLVCAIPGALAGVAVLRALDAVALQLAVTFGVLVSLAIRWRTQRAASGPAGPPPAWAVPVAGVSAGALTTSTTTAGPPLVLYLLRRAPSPSEVRDTLTVVFFGLATTGALALIVTGTRAAKPDATWLAALMPAVFAGHVAGRPIFVRLAHGHYEGVLTGVLLVAVAVGLLTAVL
jgi:uncharacterized protein